MSRTDPRLAHAAICPGHWEGGSAVPARCELPLRDILPLHLGTGHSEQTFSPQPVFAIDKESGSEMQISFRCTLNFLKMPSV